MCVCVCVRAGGRALFERDMLGCAEGFTCTHQSALCSKLGFDYRLIAHLVISPSASNYTDVSGGRLLPPSVSWSSRPKINACLPTNKARFLPESRNSAEQADGGTGQCEISAVCVTGRYITEADGWTGQCEIRAVCVTDRYITEADWGTGQCS
jgi:hypothetical protein